MNPIQGWIRLIGTKENARRLRVRLDSLKPPALDPLFGPEPKQCPLTVLYGAEVSRQVYALPAWRSVLDAWDNETVTASDLRRYCLAIERGDVPEQPFDTKLNAMLVRLQMQVNKEKLANRTSLWVDD